MSLILIVEDNEKNLKLVRDVLQVKGYKTHTNEILVDTLKHARTVVITGSRRARSVTPDQDRHCGERPCASVTDGKARAA